MSTDARPNEPTPPTAAPAAAPTPRSPESPDPLVELRDALRAFAADRDWERFHAPKNLAAALVVEAGELLEPFQWLPDDRSHQLPPDVLEAVRMEMADVLLYLVRLADRLDVDLADAARRKMAINALRYPADLARGRSDKHDRLGAVSAPPARA